jgi:hypothetical protein
LKPRFSSATVLTETNGMKKIYLDLNAASCLAIPPDSKWSDIRQRLLDGVQQGYCLCPLPLENIVEAAPCARAQREAIAELFSGISGGLAFRHFEDMVVHSTIQLIRPTWRVPSFVLVEHGWANDALATNLRSVADAKRQRMTERMANAPAPEGAEAMSVKEIFDKISGDRCGMFYRDLLKFLEHQNAPIDDYEIPWLMRGLMLHHLAEEEARDLGEKVRYHKWEAITENYFDLRLAARWEHDRVHRHRPNYKANDEIDRWRATVALSSAHLFVTDKYMAGLCQRAGVLEIANIPVLSVSQTDRFRDFLISSAAVVEN